MPDSVAGLLQIMTVLVVLVALHRPMGAYLAWVYSARRDWRLERGFYRVIGVDPSREQSSGAYLRGILVFSTVGIAFVFALQKLQALLPYSLGFGSIPNALSFNTAVSFVTNTNWQSYSPDVTMGYAVQLGGLVVQNFVSAAVGMAVAVALIRGLARVRSGTLGNFWVDLTRGLARVLVPMAVVAAVVLLAGGVIQNFGGFEHVTTLTGGSAVIPGGPVASQEAIKMLGTNGGGFFNANSAHPFENPNAFTNLFEIVLMLIIPFSMPRLFGRLVGDTRQGTAIAAVMATIFAASLTAMTIFETHGATGAMEGKETRFGVWSSTLFATATTSTSTGAVNSAHDSYSALGGMMALLDMMFGEISPGGVGSGLYGMLVLAIITVFIAGLLVGRTPEYLGKKIGPRQITLASLYILVTPTLALAGTALSFALPGVRDSVISTSIFNPGLHGVTEVLYAYTSAANNNGSAFAGLTANTDWMNISLAVVMLLGRFVPIAFVLALASSFAAQDKVPATAGTLPTHRPQFVGLLLGVSIVVTALTYFPVLALGPLAEGLN
ncbi:potassium-transporting ATPase subunit KdpA [Frondihabitans sp. PhB188]|uniref:potassium-transporting ATPase subunit KdpA n=1 Tax=Frondihabitans sp. PhB188 TaxID=2485200 RepID=UPI000F470532|nr:potassium-transporting ATPase subunit KdpA [Frondihabitans sp. PhB188]